MVFRETIHNIINSDNLSNHRRSLCKNLKVTLFFVDFSKAFDSIHRGKMEQILLAYGLPKETVTAIIMPYKNMKVNVCSPDGDKLLGHCYWYSAKGYVSPIPVYNQPRLCISNVDRSNERKWLYIKKGQKQMITSTNYYGRRWHSAFSTYTNPSWIPAA